MNKVKEDNSKRPVCPNCQKEMTRERYVGFYEEFDYWECECENLKPDHIHKGSHVWE